MSYINFQHILSKGYSSENYIDLVAIRQRNSLVLEERQVDLTFYQEKGLIVFLSNKPATYETVRLSDTGKAFLIQCETFGYTDDIGRLAETLSTMYLEYGLAEYLLGNTKKVVDRLIWFAGETWLSLSDIYYTVQGYLQWMISENNQTYVPSLENLFWRKPEKSILVVNMNLNSSPLFKYVCDSMQINYTVTIENKKDNNKALEWISSMVNCTIPKNMPEEYYFTGSYKGDVAAKKKIKQAYLDNLVKS